MSSRPHPDVLVIGAGIAGLTSAMALHRAGHGVCVVDAGAAGAESTWAGGGIVSPVPPWDYPDALNGLTERSRQLFPDLAAMLARETGIDCEYRTTGLVLLMDPGTEGMEWLAASDLEVEHGPASQFEPALADGDQPALYLPDIAQVRNPRLARGLVQWLCDRDVAIYEHRSVQAIDLAGDKVRGVQLADGSRIEADAVIVAAGAWTDRVLQASLLDGLGIHPVRGQMLLFGPDSPTIGPMVNSGAGYLIPRADGRILAGSTVEDAGFDRRPERNGYQQILEAARAMLPALDESGLECHWTGFRPGIAGGLPAIGAYPGIRGLWINAGGFRNGLGIAPAAAEVLIRQLEGGPLTETFTPRPQPPEA